MILQPASEELLNYIILVYKIDHNIININCVIEQYSLPESFLEQVIKNLNYIKLRDLLTYQRVSEKFINDPKADEMLTRKYRSPYIVPEKV